MQKFSDIVFGQLGTNLSPIVNASVTVLTYPGGTLATIYSDNGITIAANPLTTDATGRFSFYAANGRYSLKVSYFNTTYTLNDIPLEDDPVQQAVSPIYSGGTSRLLSSKIYDVVSVLDFGAQSDPTGAFDNTTAFNNAFAAGRKILIPAGTYPIKQVTIPSNSLIEGEGPGLTVLIPVTGSSMGVMMGAISVSDVELREFSMNVSRTTFPTTYPIYINGSSDVHIHHVEMPAGGLVGIYTLNATDVLVDKCRVLSCASRCIQHDGASSARTKTRECYVSNAGGVDHGIQVSGGTDHDILNNYATLTTIFGINAFQATNVKIIGNTTYNTTREGINCTDSSSCTVDDNIVYWDTTTSQDFGMSFSGQAIATNNHLIRGNRIINCGKSAIALASSTAAVNSCFVHGNIIQNSNRLNLGTTGGGGAGVIVYGTNAQNNLISDNKTIDTIGNLRYGVYEWNTSGNGSPSANKFYDNDTFGASLAPTSINTTSYEALSTPDPVAYTPTIAASSGTLTTASATGSYQLVGKMVYVRLTGTITTNGTGATSITMTLPFSASGSGGPIVLLGRETGVSGKAITGSVSAGNVTMNCLFYDNTYPGANGAIITITGCYVRT